MEAVSRERVLAYRWAAQQLDRSARQVAHSAVLGVGVRDTPAMSAWLAAAARIPELVGEAFGGGFHYAWSLRGAPHWHRSGDLGALAGALWPADDAEVDRRLVVDGSALAAEGVGALAGFERAVAALGEVVTAPMPKGEVSAEVTAMVPAAMTRWCPTCGSTHVYDDLMRMAALPAGLVLGGSRPVTLEPVAGWRPVRGRDERALAGLVRAYLRVYGPASGATVATFLGVPGGVVRAVWPEDAVALRVEGRTVGVLAEDVGLLRDAAAPVGVRLVPAADPFLQARDRELLVPDRERRRVVWRPLGNPGVVLVNGDIAGTWRARVVRRRLRVTVTGFEALSGRARRGVEQEAPLLARARGVGDAEVEFDGPGEG